MSNNCLVTKLKGTVQNDNLPEYKTIYFNIFGEGRRVVTTNKPLYYLLVGVEQGKSVTVSSLYPFHPISSTDPAVTEYVVSNGALVNLIFVQNEIPSSSVENAIKITGDIYNLTACCPYTVEAGAFVDVTDKTGKKSLQSLDYANSLISKTASIDEIISDNIKVLSIQDWPIKNNVDYSSMFNINNTVKYLHSEHGTGGGYQGVSTSCLSKLHSLHTCNVRAVGDINLLPLSIKNLRCQSSVLTGSLEDFVADRRTKGMTTGCLGFAMPTTVWMVTYNGTPIKDLSTSVRPVVEGGAFICWDANNIWWASSKPEDVNIYDSPYWATRAVLNGEL